MAFLIIVAALFSALAGIAAIFTAEYAYGVLLIGAAIIVAVAGLDAFS